MPDVGRPRDRTAGSRGVEGLSGFPWQPQIPGVALAVAARQIDADGVSPDMIERLCCRDIAPREAKGNYQFHLELEVGGEWRIGHLGAIGNPRVARLLEEERWIAFIGFFHLPYRTELIAAGAINRAHR